MRLQRKKSAGNNNNNNKKKKKNDVGKCSYCCSQQNFLIFVACLSVTFNALLYHVHIPSSAKSATRSSSSSSTDNTLLYTEFTNGSLLINIPKSTNKNTNTTSLLSTSASAKLLSSNLITALATTPMDTTKINNNCNITTTTTSSGIMSYHFEATTKYRQSKTLPQWMKDYFDWHREQTIALNECNFRDYRFMILRCSSAERKCGGLADRLNSLPFFIAAAAVSKRIFLIRWERPSKLEEFLIPNEINWSMPDWMYGKVNSFINNSPDSYYIRTANQIASGIKKYTDIIILEGLIQDYYGGSSNYYQWDCEMDISKQFNDTYYKKYNDMAGWHSYEIIFHDLFFAIFEPSPPVAKLVDEKMKSANLVSDKFATSHYRAFYAIENKKHSKEESELITKTTNALNCASKLQPGAPIFFASDSHVAVLSARKMAEDNNNREIVTFDDEQEALHLDKKDQWKSGNIADFFPTFVDLLIMADAKCMALGVGGFGRFANMISRDPTCVIRHDNERKKNIEYCNWYNE